MNESRLGELTEQEFTGMRDFVLSDEFDPWPAAGQANARLRILRDIEGDEHQ